MSATIQGTAGVGCVMLMLNCDVLAKFRHRVAQGLSRERALNIRTVSREGIYFTVNGTKSPFLFFLWHPAYTQLYYTYFYTAVCVRDPIDRCSPGKFFDKNVGGPVRAFAGVRRNSL
jgi:hypothetical protein